MTYNFDQIIGHDSGLNEAVEFIKKVSSSNCSILITGETGTGKERVARAGGEKYVLIASWDQVLGIDVERDAREAWEPSEEMRSLVAERDAARAAKDYARGDEIREALQAMGLEVMDTPEGTRVRPQVG